MKIIPSVPEVLHEAIVVAAGALLAAVVIRRLPIDWQKLFQLPVQQ